ncbi:MAG: sensor histidine kinase, partial [Promethearchaeota archaeon]
EKIKELEKIRKELVSSVSHELKTPLMSVSGASELLMNVFNDEMNSEALDLLHIIDRGTKRLEKLIERFLDISKLDFKMLNLKDQACDVSTVIEDCANEMKYLLKRREIVLSLELVEKITIRIDKLRLEQVVMNVLLNAIKNTPPKGKIYVKLKVGKENMKIIINDTGIGFTKEELKQVQKFSRFCKFQRQGIGTEYLDIQGTGLGLFISKKIIDMYDGKIYIDSKGRNQGCKCIIELPKTKNK